MIIIINIIIINIENDKYELKILKKDVGNSSETGHFWNKNWKKNKNFQE